MYRRVQRVDEAVVGVGREVDDDLRPRRDGAGYLDVEHDLAVGAVRIAGRRVVRATDRHRGDRRHRDAEPGEVFGQIGRPVAAAELEDRDRLALAVVAFGKRIQGGDLERGEAGRGRARLVLAAGLRDAEVRLDMRPVVEAEHAFDDSGELARNHDRAGPHPVFALAMPVAAEPGAERRLHRGDGSRQIDGALRQADARDVQTVRMREFFHDGDIARRGAVLGAKGFVADASERGAAGRRAKRLSCGAAAPSLRPGRICAPGRRISPRRTAPWRFRAMPRLESCLLWSCHSP